MSKKVEECLLIEELNGKKYVFLPGVDADSDITVPLKEYERMGIQKIYEKYTPSWHRQWNLNG